jgi:tetratricopeptide (TPR) repeat protein
MQAHFELVRPYIEQHSGQEVKTMGDSFMVAFGSARSAVDCAVAVQRALSKHNSENADDQVHVRMGMNTGEAIQEDGDLFGSAVDAAARVMSKAAGGQILIPENTREAIGTDDDVLLDRGPFWLKGFPERWRLYEVLWQGDKASAVPAPPRMAERTPFVGRENERADLRRYLDAARGGHGSLVMIGGEPGAGKTRITEELVAEARRHGFLTLTGHCYEMEGAPPYIPFIEILQSIMRVLEPNTLLGVLGNAAPEAAKLVPELRERFTNIPEPRKLAPEQERLYLFNNLRDFFERLGQQRPLLIVFEDLHWADESTMLLLQHIAQKLGEIPLLAVGTYRDTELDVARSLAKALEDLLRRRLAHDIILRRLPETDVAAMLKGHTEQEPPARLVELIYRETEGIPFFVEEIFKYFSEEGKLFDSMGGWRSDIEIGEAEVPRGVKLVIGRRLERVSEECRRVLTAAAVIGRDFSFELLEELAALDEDTLFDAIETAERAQLITSKTERARARFMFSHELIRQTLVSSLALPRRQRFHRRVAQAIEQLHSDTLEKRAADLAYHYYQAGSDTEKTITYSVLAAEQATAQTAYGEATIQYERALHALELQEPVDELQQCELLMSLGYAYGNTGDPSRAKEAFSRVTEIARKLPAPERFAKAVLGISRFWLMGGFVDPLQLNLMDEALALLGEEDSAARASLLGQLANILERIGDDRRISLSEQAVAMARRVGDQKALYYALVGRLFTYQGPEEKRLSDAIELAKLEEDIGSPEIVIWGPYILGHVYLTQGNISGANAALATLKKRATETSHPSPIWKVRIVEATHALMAGQFQDAKRLAHEGFDVGIKVDKVNAGQHLATILNISQWLQGQLADRKEKIEISAKKYSNIPIYVSINALMQTVLSHENEARSELGRLGTNNFECIPKDMSLTPITLMNLSEVAVALGDARRASQLYDLLKPNAGRLLVAGLYSACCGATTHWLGMLAATMQRWNDAAAHFENAIETNARIGARPFLARSQHEYARMLIERNESGDKDKARTLLDEAIPTYSELGMPTFLEDAEELLTNL